MWMNGRIWKVHKITQLFEQLLNKYKQIVDFIKNLLRTVYRFTDSNCSSDKKSKKNKFYAAAFKGKFKAFLVVIFNG